MNREPNGRKQRPKIDKSRTLPFTEFDAILKAKMREIHKKQKFTRITILPDGTERRLEDSGRELPNSLFEYNDFTGKAFI